jgi:transcriptional regulator with XRE-family HTH domain
LQKARKTKGLTRAELAKAAQSTEAAVRMWETGRRQPKMQYLIRIAQATDRDVSWFFEEVAA